MTQDLEGPVELTPTDTSDAMEMASTPVSESTPLDTDLGALASGLGALQVSQCASCGSNVGTGSNGGLASMGDTVAGATSSYVFALGRISPRFPSLGVEKEFVQVTGRAETAQLTDRQATHRVLTDPGNRYLARQLCWVLTVEGIETYILRPTSPEDVDLLTEAVRPVPRATDVDVVVGELGLMAPPELCNGLVVPVVTLNQVWSFDVDSFLGSIPRPEGVEEDQFRDTAEEVFSRVMLIADNAGATNEHRALNYVSVRYPAAYAQTADSFGRNFSLTGVEARPSRLSGVRQIVDVIFTYTDRATDVNEQYFTRVDVTEKWPFIVTKLSPYYDRS